MQKPQWVVFTDLDGTLLDWNYGFKKTLPIVKKLKEKSIPLIFCTSKTKVENEYYQKKFGIKDPFIVENGSAIFIPKNYFNFKFKYDKKVKDYFVIELGERYSKIRKAIKEIRKKYDIDILGFGDMNVGEIAKDAGLPLKLARLAKKKEYNESFKFKSKKNLERKIKLLKKELKKYGLKLDKGSRYFNIYGIKTNKGKAIKILLKLFRKKFGKIKSISIGDGINDLPMLKATSIGVLVKSKNKKWINIKEKKIIKINAINGDGFNKAIKRFVLK